MFYKQLKEGLELQNDFEVLQKEYIKIAKRNKKLNMAVKNVNMNIEELTFIT